MKSPAVLRMWMYLGELRVSGLIQTRQLIGKQQLQTSGQENGAEFCLHSVVVFSWADYGEIRRESQDCQQCEPHDIGPHGLNRLQRPQQTPFSTNWGLILQPMVEEDL